MPELLQDSEFGPITIRRSSLARSIRLKINHQGVIIISMPPRASLRLAERLINEARPQLRRNLATAQQQFTILQNGDLIGKTHRLVLREGPELHGRLIGTFIEITTPTHMDREASEVQSYIKEFVLKALRTQAKAYLTRQLRTLAEKHEFTYENVRFSNAGTRWGSCSSTGTISLNIWLMQLPFELIDYVIVHELCHTSHMNHSPAFWNLVESIAPDYRTRRRALKARRPYL